MVEPPDELEDEAAQAFDALRAEVAALRQRIEWQIQQQAKGQKTSSAPDYSPTLGKMEKSLQAIAGRLEQIEGHPALTLTPERFQADTLLAARLAAGQIIQPFTAIEQEARATIDDLKDFAGRIHTRSEHQKWIATAGVMGLITGVFFWLLLIEILPWRAGVWMATLPLRGDRWDLGSALMQGDSPQTFDKMARLYKACGNEETATCEAAMAVRAIEPPQEPIKDGPKQEGVKRGSSRETVKTMR